MTMVAAQTGPPVHLGMYSWGAQASLTRSFTQVIPALGSLEHTMLANPSFSTRPMPLPQEERSARAVSADTTVYTPIPPPGSVNIPISEFSSGTTRGSANLPICMGGNETDSGISSVSHSTLVKPRGLDQHLTSTPKTQPKLMQAAHRLTAELSAKWQGAPHGAHIQDHEGSTQKGWGGGFWGWQAPSKIHNASLDSSVVSLDDHTQLSTKLLMERDDPTRICSTFSGGEDILSVHDSSDIEMMSIVDVLGDHSRDSIPTLTRSLIPEMRTLHLGPMVGPVWPRPTVTMMTNLVTCSVPEGPFNLSKGSPSPKHSPIAAAGHKNQNHTSEP